MSDVEFLILGAGPTGIGAARRLLEHNHRDFLLLEKDAVPGGLAGSEIDPSGFTWDYGGHVQFSHYATFDRAMQAALGADGWFTHQRESWIWLKNRFVPYPFQNNLHRLDAADRDRCLQGLRAAAAHAAHANTRAHANPAHAAPTTPPANFGEWAAQTFGAGIGEIFFRPYNFKVWAYPLEMLTAKWVGERVAVPDIARIEHHIATATDDVSWGPNRTFRFPKHGGTGAVWRALGAQLPATVVQCQSAVAQIDADAKKVRLISGDSIRYKHLIATLPLDQLIFLSSCDDLIDTARNLVHSTTNLVGIGITGQPPPAIATKCWMYFPESDCPYYRATVFSRYSPFNVPDATTQWSLLVEISESPHKPVDQNNLEQQVVDGLIANRLLTDQAQICNLWRKRLPYGYPTPTLTRDETLAVLQPYLEDKQIFSRGRFGAWKYEVSNQDHSYMQGVEVIDRLLGHIDPNDGPEPTLNRPDLVNRGGRP